MGGNPGGQGWWSLGRQTLEARGGGGPEGAPIPGLLPHKPRFYLYILLERGGQKDSARKFPTKEQEELAMLLANISLDLEN